MYSDVDILSDGFPHSEIRGSTIARISPQLIAACHVLHRLLAPRHPPNALIALISNTHAHTQDQAPRKCCAVPNKCSATTTSHLFTTHPSKSAAHAASPPRHIVTNHSDSPVKHHHHPAQTLLGSVAGQRNLSCRGTCAPLQGTAISRSTLEDISNTTLTKYGDGRYRTDGPLLAKQVLYH
jgi:hypothetical protein